MTEFGSLYYTDCRPGQGLLGGAGFQFQATSGNVASNVRELVQRTALYEPPSVWMRERRPVEQYPRSLAHVADGGRYVTAVGRYLGTEADGIREGNQFTHAIVTHDPASYGLARPAQLWGASWWVGESASTTVCDPVPAEPPPGPWHAEAVRDRIAEHPEAEGWLVALLSALHRLSEPTQVRVLIISDDAETAAVWIAAATLLLPRKDALGIGFKVYTTNPHYSPHEILAVHPDWAGPLAASSGFAVFDLVEGRHASIPPTDRAKFWVARFLERDPFDVVDAVEFAGVHGRAGAQHHQDSAAEWLTAMAVFGGERAATTAQATMLADWLAAAPPDTAALAAEAVVDAVLSGAHDSSALRTLDRTVHGRGLSVLAAAVRGALAEAEVGETCRVADRCGTDHAALAPPDGSQADHAATISTIERGLSFARPEQLPTLLALASRFHITPRIATFLDAAHAFVAWWADHPGTAIDPSGWSARADLLDLLRDELALRLRDARRCETERAIYIHWWRLLWATVIEPADPLDATLIDAGTRQADAATRRKIQLAVVRRGGEDPGLLAWRVIFGERGPDPGAVLDFLHGLPADVAVSSVLAGRAYGAVQACTEPSWEALEVLRSLRPAWSPPPQYDRAVAWAAEDAAIHRVLSGMHQLSAETAPESGQMLANMSLELLSARLEELVDTLLRVKPEISELVAFRAGPSVRRLLVPALERRWKQPGKNPETGSPSGNRAAAVAFLLAGRPELDENETGDLSKRLSEAVAGMTKRQRGDIGRLLLVDNQKKWQKWASQKYGGVRGRLASIASKPRKRNG